MTSQQIQTKIRTRVLIGAAILLPVAALGIIGLMRSPQKQSTVTRKQTNVTQTQPDYQPGRLLVRLKDSVEVGLVPTKEESTLAGGTIEAGPYRIHSAPLQSVFEQRGIRSMQPLLSSSGEVFSHLRNRLYVLAFDPSVDHQQLLAEFRTLPDVEYVELDRRYIPTVVQVEPDDPGGGGGLPAPSPNDPYFSSSGSWGQTYRDQWDLVALNIPAAWMVTTGTSNTIIAVADWGIDYDHPDIQRNVWINQGEDLNHNGIVESSDVNAIDDDANGYVDDLRGWNFWDGNRIVLDTNGHATHIAGTIAAASDNATGITGICWACKIMPLRIYESTGAAYASTVIPAVEYAVNQHAAVLNMSFRGYWSQALEDTLRAAAETGGVTLIASAGNSGLGEGEVTFPASEPSVIAVASTTPDNQRSNFSQGGVDSELAAPGSGLNTGTCLYCVETGILSLKAAAVNDPEHTLDGLYLRMNGTSMAAPHVAGVVGLLKSQRPSLTPNQIRTILRQTATDINAATLPGWDPELGYGLVNAYEALRLANPLTATITSPAPNAPIAPGQMLTVIGSVGGEQFLSYDVSIAPTSTYFWQTIGQGTNTVLNGTLASWQVPASQPQEWYVLRLTVRTNDSKVLQDVRGILITI